MFMCVVNLKSVNKLDLTWKQSFLIQPTIGMESRKALHSEPNPMKLFTSGIYGGF
jgi:hypothetical protein